MLYMRKTMMSRVQSEMMIEKHSESFSTVPTAIHTDELSMSETVYGPRQSMKTNTKKLTPMDSAYFSEAGLIDKSLLLEWN